MSMIRKYHNHKLQTTPWHREEEPLNHAKAKKAGSSKLQSKLESIRREIKSDVRKQHDLYVNNLVGDVKADLKDFLSGSGVAQSDLEKAEEFNRQFTAEFDKNEHSQACPFHGQYLRSQGSSYSTSQRIKPLKSFASSHIH